MMTATIGYTGPDMTADTDGAAPREKSVAAVQLDPSRLDEATAMTMTAAEQASRRLGFTG